MTLTQYLDAFCEKLNIAACPDRLLTTYWEAIAKAHGVDVAALPDKLVSTYLEAILKAKGVTSVPDKLVTTQLEALAGVYGATNLPDRMIGTYLEAIVNGTGGDDGNLWNPATNSIEQGYYASSSGVATSSSNMIRIKNPIYVKPSTSYSIESNMGVVMVLAYDADGNFVKLLNSWTSGTVTAKTTAETAYIKINFRANPSAPITPSDFEWLRVVEN